MNCHHCGDWIEVQPAAQIWIEDSIADCWATVGTGGRVVLCRDGRYHQPKLPPFIPIEEIIAGLQRIEEDLR